MCVCFRGRGDRVRTTHENESLVSIKCTLKNIILLLYVISPYLHFNTDTNNKEIKYIQIFLCRTFKCTTVPNII